MTRDGSFVCATSKETGDTVHLTSYRSPRGRERLFQSTKIWEAGRATSAASSFFDPIIIGEFGEGFVDSATGAKNPVYELWNEAQDIWPSTTFENSVQCLVSIGTGVPSLKPFSDDLVGVGQSLLAIATETEKTAERFNRDKSQLDDDGRYYRFNVLHGLEDVGLEDSKQKSAIVAATDRYIESQAVFKKMKACGNSTAEKRRKSPNDGDLDRLLSDELIRPACFRMTTFSSVEIPLQIHNLHFAAAKKAYKKVMFGNVMRFTGSRLVGPFNDAWYCPFG